MAQEQQSVWFFHDQAEFIPSEIGEVQVTTVLDAPESWESRLGYAGFTQTKQGWSKAGLIDERVATYVTGGDVETRNVSPEFFMAERPGPAESEQKTIIPKLILEELKVFQNGSMDGMMLELGEGGEPCPKHVAVAVLERAANSVLDDQTAIAYEMAYLRLDEAAQNSPEISAFADTLRLEQTVGYNWELRKGELLAEKGQPFEVDGVTGRLAADYHAKDKGAWLLKEPCIWVEGTYTAPDYSWVSADELNKQLAPPEPEQAPAPAPVETPPTTTAPQEQRQADLFLVPPEGVVGEAKTPPKGPTEEPPQEQAPAAEPDSTETTTEEDTFEPAGFGYVRQTDDDKGLVEYTAKTARDIEAEVARLPEADLSGERFAQLIQGELVPIGKSMRPDGDAEDGHYALVGDRVLISFDDSWEWTHDVTEQCPGLAEYAKSAAELTSDFSQNVDLAWTGYFDLEIENELMLSAPEVYPYLKDGRGGMSEERAVTAAQDAATKRGEPHTGSQFDTQVELNKLGLVEKALTRASNFGSVQWEDHRDDWRKHCLHTLATIEARKEYSIAMMQEQVKVAEIEGEQLIDSARIGAAASMISREAFSRGNLHDVREVLERVPFDTLADDQHLFVAVAGYGRRGGQWAGMGINHPLAPPRADTEGGQTTYTAISAAGVGVDSWRSQAPLGSMYFERKLQNIRMHPTYMSPAADGKDAMLSMVTNGKHNVPGMNTLRMQSSSDKEDVESHRNLGIGYVMNDGSFGVAPLHKSETMALRNDGAFEKLMGYYQNAPELDHTSSSMGDMENAFERMAELAADGELTADTSEYFDPSSRAYTMMAGAAQAAYASDVVQVNNNIKSIIADPEQAPAFFEWMRNCILDGVNPRLLDGSSDEWLTDIQDYYADPQFMKGFTEKGTPDAMALVINRRGARTIGVNTSRQPESVLENPRSVLIDKHRKTRPGMKSGRLTLVDMMHYTMPEVAEGLNQGGLVDFLRGDMQQPEATLEQDAGAGQSKSGRLEDIGVVAGLSIKDLYSRDLDGKNAALRAMTELQREKVAKRETFVARPRMQEYQDAGATPAFAVFMDRTWLDLPNKPASMTVADIEAYGAIMEPMGKAFEEIRKNLPELVKTANQKADELMISTGMAEQVKAMGLKAEDSGVELARNIFLFTAMGEQWVDALEKHVVPEWKKISAQPEQRSYRRPYHEQVASNERRGATWGAGKWFQRKAGTIGYSPFNAVKTLAGQGVLNENVKAEVVKAITTIYSADATFKLGRQDTCLLAVDWPDLIRKRSSTPRAEKGDGIVGHHERIGDDYRKGKDVVDTDFMQTFGFSGVEYGTWVSAAERQAHLNLTYDSMLDLSKHLDVEPMALSLGGQLGLSFGGRGRGGINAPIAHFEPVNMAINLTRQKGAGTLAHEYFHAIANHYGRLETGRPTADYSTLMGVGLSAKTADPKLMDVDDLSAERINPELQKSFYELMVAIMRKPEDHLATGNDISSFKEPSDMLERAKELDAERSSPYWATSAEMFARAMESCLGAELMAKGHRNDYLVAPERISAGGAYPTDDEFEKIRPYAKQWASDLQTRMEAVQHAYLGAVEIPVLYSKNGVVKPFTHDELETFVKNEFSRMFGNKQAPQVSIESGLGAAGAYHRAENLVRLAAEGADERVVYHEGWHVARDFLLDDEQGEKVDRTFANSEIVDWVTDQMREQGYSQEAVEDAQSNSLEAQAYAFELWATDQLDFEALADVYAATKNEIDQMTGLTGLLTQQELERVFEDVFSGRMAQAAEQDQQANADMQGAEAVDTGQSVAYDLRL